MKPPDLIDNLDALDDTLLTLEDILAAEFRRLEYEDARDEEEMARLRLFCGACIIAPLLIVILVAILAGLSAQ